MKPAQLTDNLASMTIHLFPRSIPRNMDVSNVTSSQERNLNQIYQVLILQGEKQLPAF